MKNETRRKKRYTIKVKSKYAMKLWISRQKVDTQSESGYTVKKWIRSKKEWIRSEKVDTQ